MAKKSIATQFITAIPHFGDSNSNVAIVQQQLQLLGINTGILVDGVFGSQTLNSIKKLQKIKDLVVDGIIGKQTLAALRIEVVTQTHSNGYAPLSWEVNHPERKKWSDYVHQIVEGLLDEKFSNCTDIKDFRTNYSQLSKQQKINVWGELICGICYHESSWNPCSWMLEDMGTDPITKEQVRSEGLMQLSYQDTLAYKNLPCRFNWKTDKNLSRTNPNKTIFNPTINLEFGINILAHQIVNTGKIALEKNVYWAVLKVKGKYTQLPAIIASVQNFKV